jgi:drug/metabolite transporter (DMT)-like permease
MKKGSIGLFNAFLMITLILFWGSSFVVVKISLMEGMTPVSIATFRFLFAGGLFGGALLLKKRRKPSYGSIQRKDILKLLLLALSGITFFFTAQYTGIQMAGAALAAIFVCLLAPILITIFSSRILKEKLSRRQNFGIVVAALGTLIIITSGTLGVQGNEKFFLGSLILLLTPFLWTFYSISGKKMMEKYDPFLIVTYVTLMGGACLVPFSLVENSLNQILTMSLISWLAILYLSLSCSLVGYYIWFYMIKQVGASVTSSFLFAEPLITVLFASVFVGEEMTLSILFGGLLIFSGVFLATRKRNSVTK